MSDRPNMSCELQDEAWFASAALEWDELVADSDCDPLFNGWAWRRCWWEHYGRTGNARLALLVLRADAKLCAILPLYLHEARVRIVPVQRVQLLGSDLRGAGTGEFSEYCDACVRRGSEALAAEHFARALSELRWHEFFAQCVPENSWLERWLVPELERRGATTRRVDPFVSWGVDLRPGYDAWRGWLSGNVRRRAIGQRNRLADAQLVQIAPDQFERFVNDLNTCHIERWGKPVYGPVRVAFHNQLLAQLPVEALAASVLMDGEAQISMLYNLRVAGRVYNMQSGFRAHPEQKLSAGYLHLGYAIERCAGEGAQYFDMLGGDGKNRAYKADLGTPGCRMTSLQIVRAPWLKLLYAVWDRWREFRARDDAGAAAPSGPKQDD